jgi:hypothetical protein
MSNWQPLRLTVGDMVQNPEKPKWGVGEVLDVEELGELPLPLGGKIRYQQNTVGQCASVRFEDGRTRNILTPKTPLVLIKK